MSTDQELWIKNTVDRVIRRWTNANPETTRATIAEARIFLAANGQRDIFAASADQLEAYLMTVPAIERASARTALKRFMAIAVAQDLISTSPLPAPRKPFLALDEILSRHPEVNVVIRFLEPGYTTTSRNQLRNIVARFVLWCEREHVDPVRITNAQAMRFVKENAPGDPTYWTDMSWLRHFFDAAIELGLRPTHPLPRAVNKGIDAAEDDPLAVLVRKVARGYGRESRDGITSLLTKVIVAARDHGDDPLDLAPSQFDFLFSPKDPLTSRVWRSYGQLLTLADQKHMLGPRGQQLLKRIELTSQTGRRRNNARWIRWVAEQGFEDPGAVPVLRREQFISQMRAEGASDGDIAAMRSLIRDHERRAVVAGVRAERRMRHDRLGARLESVGLPPDRFDAFVEAFHEGYAPSSLRWRDSILVQYLDYCLANGIDPTRGRERDIEGFRKSITVVRPDGSKRVPGLGVAPVRRFLIAFEKAMHAPASVEPPVSSPEEDDPVIVLPEQAEPAGVTSGL